MEEIFQTYLSSIKDELSDAAGKLKEMTPEPMNTMLDKQPREEAIQTKVKRAKMVVHQVRQQFSIKCRRLLETDLMVIWSLTFNQENMAMYEIYPSWLKYSNVKEGYYTLTNGPRSTGSLSSVIVQVGVVLRRTVADDTDLCFSNLNGCHLQSQNFDTKDCNWSDCRNVSQCHQQQFFSELN